MASNLFFSHFGLAKEESLGVIDQDHQRYTTFMNDDILNSFMLAPDSFPTGRYHSLSDEVLVAITGSSKITLPANNNWQIIIELLITDDSQLGSKSKMIFLRKPMTRKELINECQQKQLPFWQGSRQHTKKALRDILESYEFLPRMMEDNNIRLHLSTPSTASLVISSRWSSQLSKTKRADHEKIHHGIEDSFIKGGFGIKWKPPKSGSIMSGDHSAKDRWFPDKKSRGAPQQWMNFFDSLPPHTEVVICLLGCEGVGVDIDHWKVFWARFGQNHQRKIILMIGETDND